MPTLILGIADPHFSDKRPRARKDDFLETQRKKLREIWKLSKGINWKGTVVKPSALLIAGDTFHQPKGKLISRKLDHELMKIFRDFECPIFAIAGNHDMLGDRLDSLDDHPLGTLVASGLVKLTHWPEYAVVGTDPPVIITGREYKMEGPGKWLQHIASTKWLHNLKARISEDTGKEAQAHVMTHNFWGPEDGNIFGDIVVGHGNVVGTGIDALLYGHPHSDDGVVLVPDGDRTVSIIGPGAMLRNTIAEHDVTRRPKIAITAHDSDGNHEVITAAIPHAAPELVFDLEKHERVKKERAAEERFILELSRLQATTKSPEEILESAGERFSPRVLTRTREFLAAAEAEVA